MVVYTTMTIQSLGHTDPRLERFGDKLCYMLTTNCSWGEQSTGMTEHTVKMRNYNVSRDTVPTTTGETGRMLLNDKYMGRLKDQG